MKLGNGSDDNNNKKKKRKSKVQAVFSQAAECTLASSHQFGVWVGWGELRGGEVGIGP